MALYTAKKKGKKPCSVKNSKLILFCEYESDLRSNEHHLSSSEKAWKKFGIWTHDLCDTGAVLYQLN